MIKTALCDDDAGLRDKLPGPLKLETAMERQKVDMLLLFHLSCLGTDPG